MEELIREINAIGAKVINEELWPRHFNVPLGDLIIPDDL